MKFNEIYKELLKQIWFNGIETNPRNMKCKELIGISFILEDPNDNIITIPNFETNLNYAKNEFAWYLSGTDRIDFNEKIQKIWIKYSDDGITVNSNYGNRIYGNKKGFINQWEWIKEKLKNDSSSRQCVFNINCIEDKFKETKDFPCTMYAQVFIRENKLYWLTNMRSNDIFFGTRNDVYCFTEWQKLLANELKIDLGSYIHFTGSIHLYENCYSKVEKLLEEK